ncbi:hypothetical protein FRC04_008043 [Tulasnella sp. 424]|nr:hypothetical protein FRC04_008043 [Tulasnella sp. 424]KAG8974703.1 hypothetical protein FRC05_006863 [Tulasnella sp. 425]
MQPPKKRQKINENGSTGSIRSATLLDFFRPPTSKTVATPVRTPSSNSKGKQKAVAPPDNADIIVISDDEDYQMQPLPLGPSTSFSSIGSSTSSKASLFHTSVQSIELDDSNPGPSTAKCNLPRNRGQPSSKILEPNEKSRVEEPIPQRECTPPPPEPSIIDSYSTPVSNPVENSTSRSIPAAQEVEENEWLNGDDEIIEIEDDSDEGERYGDEEEGLYRTGKNGDCLGEIVLDEAEASSTCPVCNIRVDGWSSDDLSEHVNSCLDSPPISKQSLTPRQDISSCVPPQSSSKPTPSNSSSRGPNAFSLLMSSRKENEAWKLAEVDLAKPDSVVGKARRSEGRRKAPFYKVLQGMPIAVDAFRYGKIPGVTAYFLTHAHSDHYTNLSSKWKNGPIYCSRTTANLIKLMLQVDPKWVCALDFDKPFVIPDTGGVEVTVLEANHCPGSSLFLFKGKQTVNAGDSGFNSPYVGSSKVFRYLHCGDFRASPRHVLHPAIKGYKLDIVYLDTTYLNAKYCFPPQKQVIEACAELARTLVSKGDSTSLAGLAQPSVGKWLTKVEDDMDVKPEPVDDPSRKLDEEVGALVKEEEFTEAPMEEETFDPGFPTTEDEEKPDLNLIEDEGKPLAASASAESKRILVVVGTYSIGKERIVKAVAKALESKVYCDTRKRAILLCQDDPDLHGMLTNDPMEAQVHLVPLQTINLEKIEPYFTKFRGSFGSVIGFRPTGWTYSAPAGTDLFPSVGQVISRPQKTFTSSSLNLMRNSNAKYRLYGVPYSEHSSFHELTCFALSVDVVKIIATVNVGSAKSRGMMNKWFEKWEAERKKRAKEGKDKIVPYRCLDYW